jgi:predicted ATPase
VLVAALGARQLLLVLDNCEQVVDSCAALAAELLLRCPELRILATSRLPLHISGETIWQVNALSLPDVAAERSAAATARSEAVRLFVERARALFPKFVLTDQNSAAVAEICVRLGGVALAIELAAAWIRVLSPAELAIRLSDGLGLLVGGVRDAPERQRTLRATLDWSYRLLTEAERSLLSRLSVFAGRWTAGCCRGSLYGRRH